MLPTLPCLNLGENVIYTVGMVSTGTYLWSPTFLVYLWEERNHGKVNLVEGDNPYQGITRRPFIEFYVPVVLSPVCACLNNEYSTKRSSLDGELFKFLTCSAAASKSYQRRQKTERLYFDLWPGWKLCKLNNFDVDSSRYSLICKLLKRVKAIKEDSLSPKGILAFIASNDQSHFHRVTFVDRFHQLVTTYLL